MEPGYGGSTPQPGRSIADCAGDVRAICAALEIDRLAMWGGSGGGAHTEVPFGHGQWLATHTPGVEARLLDNDGHATLAAHHIGDVRSWLSERL